MLIEHGPVVFLKGTSHWIEKNKWIEFYISLHPMALALMKETPSGHAHDLRIAAYASFKSIANFMVNYLQLS